MTKITDMRRAHNPDPAQAMPLGEWENPAFWKFTDCYGATECFEQALVDSEGNVAGKVIPGFSYSGFSGISNFGLNYRVRRIGDVAEALYKRKEKRARDAANREAAKEYVEVKTITYDGKWDVTEMTTEQRIVYSNKDGSRHIKTRSNGSPRVHRVGDKNYVVYGPVYRPSNPERYDIRPLRVLPDECPLT